MKEVIKHLRIATARIFLDIGHKIDARDTYDMEAELRRLDPDYQKAQNTNSK